MRILVNSDSSIAMNAKLMRSVVKEAGELFDRFSDRLTRVEIHLSDIDRGKTGKVDKRCLVEARAARMKPIVTSANAVELKTAVNQAMRKMVRALNTSLGKQDLLRTVKKPIPVVVPAAKKRAAKRAPAKKKAAKKRVSPRGPKKRLRMRKPVNRGANR